MEDRQAWMAARHIASGLSEIGIATNSWRQNVEKCTTGLATELSANCIKEELEFLLAVIKAAIAIEKKNDNKKK